MQKNVPVIADGGIRYSGDLTKAIAACADAVMIGGLFAPLAESPGEQILYQGADLQGLSRHGLAGGHGQGIERTLPAKRHRTRPGKLPRRGRRPGSFKGALSSFVYQLVGGLRAGMGYCGTQTIEELGQNSIHSNHFGGG